MSYLIIECGSSARGDTNPSSDIDRVCIWEATPNFSSIEKEFGPVMFYSLETIKKMRAKGSLFLTHLDIDSIYISGNKDLMRFYKGYRPSKIQVRKLLDDTINFIASIKWYPNTPLGKLWLCDVLYVSIRSCIYCKNALNERYAFGYDSALKELDLNKDTYATMLKIREGKYAYRKKVIQNNIWTDIKYIENACRDILKHPIEFKNGGVTNWQGTWRKDYWGERLIERAIINNEHADDLFMQRITQHNYNKFKLKCSISEIINMHTSNKH